MVVEFVISSLHSTSMDTYTRKQKSLSLRSFLLVASAIAAAFILVYHDNAFFPSALGAEIYIKKVRTHIWFKIPPIRTMNHCRQLLLSAEIRQSPAASLSTSLRPTDL